MRVLAPSVLFVGFFASWAKGDDRLDRLFMSWAEAQRDIKALVVEFNLETRDSITGKREKSDGTIRLMRTPVGDVLASYQVAEPAGTRDRWSGLLNGGTVYLLNHDKKTAVRFERQTDDELRRFLEEYFNPFVWLLDRKRVEESCRLEVVKQDEFYTYLLVTPKQVKRTGWLPDHFHAGRAVFMRKRSASVPKTCPGSSGTPTARRTSLLISQRGGTIPPRVRKSGSSRSPRTARGGRSVTGLSG
jgi:hypothetical protein